MSLYGGTTSTHDQVQDDRGLRNANNRKNIVDVANKSLVNISIINQ